MRIQKKSQEESRTGSVLMPLTAPQVDRGGGGPLEKDHATRFFPSKQKIRQRKKFWSKTGLQVNDNISLRPKFKKASLVMFCVILISGILVNFNRSEIATQLVTHADDTVLEAVMDANPDALAALLNEVNVGE